MQIVRLLRPFHRARPGRALCVGVTGGIGSGKSTLTRLLADSGAATAAADDIARRLLQPGGAAVQPVLQHFGDAVGDGRGGIDRAALARLVFTDEDARRYLETLTHPLIARAASEFFAAATPGTVAVYDVPLLVESAGQDYCDAVIVVHAPLRVRLERLARRGMDEAEARRRMAVQADDAERAAAAHALVENAGTRAELHGAVTSVLWPALTAAAAG